MTDLLSNAVAGIVATLAACAWLAPNRQREDADTAQCHEYVLDSLSDADLVRKVDCLTDGTLRDQLTLQDAIDLHAEAELSKMGHRRN